MSRTFFVLVLILMGVSSSFVLCQSWVTMSNR